MITVRPATINDARTIIEFQKKMALETENLVLDDNKITPGVISVFSEPAKGRYYVATDGGLVISSLLITTEWSDWRNAEVWWFQSVYVLPAYRRKGIFRAMYDYIKESAVKQKAAGLRLYVEPSNVAARRTYESLGMKCDHYVMYEWLTGN